MEAQGSGLGVQTVWAAQGDETETARVVLLKRMNNEHTRAQSMLAVPFSQQIRS